MLSSLSSARASPAAIASFARLTTRWTISSSTSSKLLHQGKTVFSRSSPNACRARCGKPSNKAALDPLAVFTDQSDHDLVGNQFTVHNIRNDFTHLGARGAQRTACPRSTVASCWADQCWCLRSFTPGGPNRIFIDERVLFLACLSFTTQLRFLNQTFVLMRQEMRLYLLNGIHCYRNHDRQRGSTEVKRNLNSLSFGQ